MIADRWRRVDELFAAALELGDGEERRRLLDARCAGDGDLRAEVERLLAADRAADGFLETPPFAALQAALQAARARPAPGDLAPGTAVGRYRVIDKIGEGGMGAVYAAHDPELGRTVALKLVHPDEASGASRDRLLREAQALARVSHPHVVTVHDVGRHGEAVFLAMEYVAGGTLDDWLRARPRGWREVVAAFLPAAHGLAAAHAAGIVHRDFKPSNVLRGDDGRTRVADFGLARAAPEGATVLPLIAPPRRAAAVPPAGDGDAGEPAAPVPFPSGRWLASRLTATGRALGTPSFMAPEQHAGGEVGPATDQFAFCVALWQALYGEHPFAGGSPAETRARVLAGEVAPAPSGARVPAWLRAVLLRGLAVRPERRWGSLAELAQAIERRTARRRAPLALAVALAVAVAALAVWAALAPSAAPPAAAVETVAVLPFAGAGEDAALGRGIADELVVALRRVDGVEVAAGSSLDPATRGLGIAEVADRLGAGRVLDGAVERDGGRLRVEAQLRDAADGRVVWSLARERPAGELFALQEELARAVLDRLAAGSPAAGDPLIDRGTESLAAYSLYLKGREHWGRRDHQGLGRAIGYFERAIAEDPGYGRAWSGLADAHAWRTVYDPAADPDALTKARAAAGRALELAPGSAESHATLGLLALIGGEHAEAEAGLLRAIELDPRYAPARHWYGVLLARTLHRYDDAIAELERARRLDPGSSPILAMLAGAYYLAGRHQEALAAEEELVVLDPEWTVGGTCLARNHLALGRPREAIAAVARLPAALAGSVPCLRDLAQAHHLAGDYPAELAAARRGLALAPDDPYLVESEGAALAALGREEEVRALVGRVLGGFESGGYAWYGLFNVLGELRVHGRPELARELAREIAAWHGRRFPPGRPVDEATFLPTLALVLARLEAGEPAGEPAAALAAWLAAAGTDVRRASGFSEHRLLGIEGWMAALAGDRATARARLAALDEHPADSEAAPYEAMILAALGEREGALAALDRRLAAGLVRNRELHAQVGLAPLAGPALERRLAARGPAAAGR